MKAIYLILLALLGGCASVQLTQRGAAVSILSNPISPSLLSTRSYSCYADTFVPERNLTYCTNSLRNQAGMNGDSAIAINTQEIGNSRCGYCVKMSATGYKQALAGH